MKKRILACFMVLCMALSAVPAFAVPDGAAVAAPSLAGDTAVYAGKSATMRATVTGLSGIAEGATAVWMIDGKTVQTKPNLTVKNGDVLTLNYTLPETTKTKHHKISLTLTHQGRTIAYAETTVLMKFGFAGASMTLSKSEHVTSGNTRRVKVTVKGLQENLTVSYRWYVDGKAVSKPRGTRTLKKGTNSFTYSYKAKATGRHTIKLVLKSEDGAVSMSSPVKTLTVHQKYAKTLASYTTQFAASNRNRSTNLRIAIQAINGKVVKPGKTFSFNQATGRRTASKGYKNAVIYVGGQSVPGLAGGVCQVSSTAFNAALLSNMTIVSRYNHSAPVTYVPKGRDAAVAYDAGKDLKFRNNLSVPVKVVATYNPSGSITVKIKADYGTQIKKPTLKVSYGSGSSRYILRRYVGGKVNYTAYSRN